MLAVSAMPAFALPDKEPGNKRPKKKVRASFWKQADAKAAEIKRPLQTA
jgi:hypothetical protein